MSNLIQMILRMLGGNADVIERLSHSKPIKWAARRSAWLYHWGRSKGHLLEEELRNSQQTQQVEKRFDSFRSTFKEEFQKGLNDMRRDQSKNKGNNRRIK